MTRKATLVQVVFLIYGAACGGAFGLEGMVSAAGPGMALATLALMPFLWSIPISLSCAELSSAFPVEGGYYQWSRMAYGDLVGFLAGWWTWLGIFATNATFAVMFADYLGFWVPLSPLAHWLVALSLVWGITYLNHRGIRAMGESSIWMTALLLVPFVILTLLGLAHWRVNPFTPFVPPQKTTFQAFGSGLLLSVWLFSGYEKITVSAEEIENPTRTLPLALAIAVPLVACSYLLPTFGALAGGAPWAEWKDNYFSEAAKIVGGPWLGHAMTVAALISNALLLGSTMLAQSRLPLAMAKDKLFPRAFGRLHPRFQTPTFSLFFGSAILSLLCVNSFSQLVAIYGVTQVLSYLLIYATLWRLRKSRKTTRRPFQIPGGAFGFLALVTPPVCIAFVALFKTDQLLLPLVALASGPLVYLLFKRTTI